MRLAVFDLDGTLLGGPSSERRFALWLLRRGALGPQQWLAWLGFLALAWPRFGRHTPKKDKGYVAGLRSADVAALAVRFVDEELLPRLDAATLAELECHRAQGEPVVLLSGTLQPVADALAARLGLDRAIGSCPPEREGRYAIGPPTRHPFGAEKLALVETLCAERGLTLDAVTAYADSIDDRWLLERVGAPVAVAPSPALARLARRRAWPILAHRGALAKSAPPVQAP